MQGQTIPRVVDLFHGDNVTNFEAAAAAGVWGIIHKASQGAATNPFSTLYARRRQFARAAGLLWGAYHYMTAAPVEQQVANFLNTAMVDKDTLVALDFEPGRTHSTTPSLDQARAFLAQIFDKLGRHAVLYSGSLLKETLGKSKDEFFAAHRLWLCEYAPAWRLEPLVNWPRPWLWQYTDGSPDAVKLGALPAPKVPGIPGSIGQLDCNYYDGTREQLVSEWAA